MGDSAIRGSDQPSAFEAFLARAHRPAHARRTAEANAAFLLPLLSPGMRLLDAGCGPGSITLGLAAATAPGRVLGLDVDPGVLAMARQAAEAAGADNVEFQQGSVYDIPAADGTFDAAYSHATFQHLEEPGRALGEMARVLRPGGVIGIADADYDASLIWPADDQLLRGLAITIAVREHAPGDPRVGRRLGTLLAGAGFADVVVSATAMTQGTEPATRAEAENVARTLEAPAFQERAARLGVAEPGEFDGAAGAWRRWGQTPGACWVRVWIHAIGRKPGGES